MIGLRSNWQGLVNIAWILLASRRRPPRDRTLPRWSLRSTTACLTLAPFAVALRDGRLTSRPVSLTLARLGGGGRNNPKASVGFDRVPKTTLTTHGQTRLTRRRAPPARPKVKCPAATPCQNWQNTGPSRRASKRRWTPCEKQGRGGFWVDGGGASKDTRRGAIMHSNMEC